MIKENRYVPESYKEDSQKSYIESFLLRIKNISNDNNSYTHDLNKESFSEAIEILKTHYETGIHDHNPQVPLIFEIASIYTTFILKEPIHPVGTPFPGSLKVEEKNGTFLCPVKDANIDTPNADVTYVYQNNWNFKPTHLIIYSTSRILIQIQPYIRHIY